VNSPPAAFLIKETVPCEIKNAVKIPFFFLVVVFLQALLLNSASFGVFVDYRYSLYKIVSLYL
jgi:hypothetical protein